MGKAKKRNFRSAINTGEIAAGFSDSMSRQEAIDFVAKNIEKKDYGVQTKDIISLFGITAEELAEAGAAYEDLVALRALLI